MTATLGSRPAAVVFEGVSKHYRVYRQRNRALKDILLRGRLGSWEDRPVLADVSFEIARGDSVALIGPNGAGKSTALKLVARILEPDRGRVVSHGRLGSLIELGAGFHPESTGRENVFLNASLLGMSDRDIKARLDAVVAFAGLESVIDQPLRTYSSGMQVRLGFSVAIHTDPDVLLLDEVLAVGDESFQIRCFEYIRRFKSAGGTLVFVSHSMDAVREVCSQAIWIEAGKVQASGPAGEVTTAYLTQVHASWEEGLAAPGGTAGDSATVVLGHARLLDCDGRPADQFEIGGSLRVEIPYRRQRALPGAVFGVAVHRVDGIYVYGTNTQVDRVAVPALAESGTVAFNFDDLRLLPGAYRLSVAVMAADGLVPIDFHEQRYGFRVTGSGEEHGVVRLGHSWAFGEPGE